jgi:hypothetical protein
VISRLLDHVKACNHFKMDGDGGALLHHARETAVWLTALASKRDTIENRFPPTKSRHGAYTVFAFLSELQAARRPRTAGNCDKVIPPAGHIG